MQHANPSQSNDRRRFRGLAIAFAVSLVVGATVYAAAASLTVTSNDVGAGVGTQASCDAAVSTTHSVAWDTSDGQFEIDSVTVSGIAAPACDNQDIIVTLSDNTQAMLGTGTDTDYTNDGSETVAIPDDANRGAASAVTEVHVAIYAP